MSPEVINNDQKCGSYSDLWAVGCILYCLIYKNPPFDAKTEYLIFQNINHLNFYFPESRLVDSDVKNFINSLLRINPKERLGGNGDFEELKNHEFFRLFNSESIYSDLNSLFAVKKYRKSSMNCKTVIKSKKNEKQNIKLFNKDNNNNTDSDNDNDNDNNDNKDNNDKNIFFLNDIKIKKKIYNSNHDLPILNENKNDIFTKHNELIKKVK